MAGNTSGGKKAAETNKKLHGDDFYARIGRMGGMSGHTGGFAQDPDRAREAGRKGGKISKSHGWKPLTDDDIYARFADCIDPYSLDSARDKILRRKTLTREQIELTDKLYDMTKERILKRIENDIKGA